MTVQPTRDQLRALADKATPPPWKIDEYDENPLTSIVSTADDRMWGWVEVARSMDADAAFIAAAREAVPRLLDQLDQAEARIKAVEDVLAAWHVEPGESGLADDLLRALNT